MKTLITIIAVLIMCGTAAASPFLVCDPYDAAVGVDTFVITIDGGTAYTSPAQVMTDGKTRLYLDLGSVTSGSHSMTIKARNVWGDSATAPFEFTKSVPSAPVGIGLVK
jgi:hypothetical protein